MMQLLVAFKGLLILLLHVHASSAISSVQNPPLIIKQPPVGELLFQVAIRIDENPKPFIIECEAEGTPEPSYNWTKNGVPFNWEDHSDRIKQQAGRGTLVVDTPEAEDAGQYQCFASNSLGVATSNTVFVRKSELNSFKDDQTISTVSTQEGRPFKLPCEAPYGWPKPILYWMLQNQLGALKSINNSRNTVDPEGTLWFSNVTLGDRSSEFNYACSAYSPFRNEYKLGNRVYLNVAPMGSDSNKVDPVWQYVTKKSTAGIRGQTLDLWCVAGGTPIPEIRWSKRGGLLPFDRIEYENYGKTLKIMNADFTDEGTYICEADNGIGQTLTHSITVSINAAPYFKTEPEIVNEAESETVVFQCEAMGKPNPDIKWIHNGRPIEQAPHNPRRKLQRNKVTLTNILKSDTGNYGCNASNSLGYVYKDVYLNVLALPPDFTAVPKNTTTTEGSMVILTCRVLGAPKPEITWQRGADTLTGKGYKVLANGDLQIAKVQFDDAGLYECFAKNKFGADSRYGSLAVKSHTIIHQDGRPTDSEVAAGTSATFKCNAESDDSLPLHVDWYADGDLIDFDRNHRFVKMPDNSLVIDKTIDQDSGTYTCIARTEYDNATAAAQLIVQDVPSRPELIDVDCGPSTARISWKPTGHNHAPIMYYTIQENTSFTPDYWGIAFKDVPATENSYTVKMSPWANYTFRVIARNKIGPSLPSAHSRVCTTPKDVPHKNPENVRGDGTAPTNLRISWTPMPEIEHNGPGFKYVVKWRPEDEGETEYYTREVTDWRVSEIIIPEQPTYRPYAIHVRAVNSEGESTMAPTVIRGYSGQAVPSEAPSNFTLLDKIDGRTALVAWNPVLPQSLNGKFEGYKVETWTENDGDDNTREILVKNDVTKAVVDKLVPFSRNFLRVFAYNTVYNGPPSRYIEVVTGEGTPGPVESFDAFALGPDSIYLKWQKPEQPNGILRGYFLTWSEVNGTQIKTETERTKNITDPTKLETKLSHLKRLTTYRIGIEAYTGEGKGDGRFTEMRTLDGAAVLLAKPRFRWDHEPVEDGVTGVKIVWIPGTDGEGRPGDQFSVKYKKYGSDTFLETEIVTDEDFKIVRGLDPEEIYIFQVVAIDSINPTVRKESNAEEIYTKYPDGPYVQPKEAGPAAGWFIGLIVALAFLLLCLILICIVKRNRGGKYAVYEREIAHGRHEFDDGGFREFSQPSGRSSMMDSAYRPQESDTDSMQGDEAAKFTEDGSFIGQYGVKKKSELPSPTAAYV